MAIICFSVGLDLAPRSLRSVSFRLEILRDGPALKVHEQTIKDNSVRQPMRKDILFMVALAYWVALTDPSTQKSKSRLLQPCCGFVADLLRIKSLMLNVVADVKDFQTIYAKYISRR